MLPHSVSRDLILLATWKSVAVLLGFVLLILGLPHPAAGDLMVMRDVVTGPKGSAAAANIGSVNSSPNIHMDQARVDINVGTPGEGPVAPVPLTVVATFEMVNQSQHELHLTVGFPISNSEFSSSRINWFRVMVDGDTRDVFRRITGYPRRLTHEYVSGESGPDNARPPTDVNRSSLKLMGDQIIGNERYGNLMVWEERFSAGETKTIDVRYSIQIPLQENAVKKRRVEGNSKGKWPEEANNLPTWFLKRLPQKYYYFFDYYLTSGASWAGTIGVEDIYLHLGPWWNGHEFHASTTRILTSGGSMAGPGSSTTHYLQIRNQDPLEDLYFAVRPADRK